MTTLWFDLEATVIKSWDTPFIINQLKIFNFLKELEKRGYDLTTLKFEVKLKNDVK